MNRQLTRRAFLHLTGTGAGAVLLAACAPKVVEKVVKEEVPVEVTRIVKEVVKETVMVEGTPQVVEREVTKVVKETVVVEKPAEKAPEEKIKVRLGDPGQPGKQYHFEEVYDQALPQFEITREYAPWGEHHEKLMTQMAAGTSPDVVFISYTFYRETVEKDLYLDLGPFMDADGTFDPMGFTVPIDLQGWKGTRFAVQQCLSDPPGWVYNTDAFEEAGLSLPPLVGEPGHDEHHWDDILAWAEKLTKRDASGRVERYGISSPYRNTSYNAMYWFQNGGEIFEKTNNLQIDPKKSTINSPECVEAFQFNVDMVNKHEFAPTSAESEALGPSNEAWLTGRFAIFHRWWHFDSANTDKFGWRGMHIPWQKRNASYNLFSNCWVIPGPSTQKQAAWDIIAACTTWPVFLRQQIRCNRPAYQTEYWISQMPPAQQAYEKEMFSRFDPDDFSNQTPGLAPNYGGGEINSALTTEIEAMYAEAKTVQQALDDAQRKIEEILKEYI